MYPSSLVIPINPALEGKWISESDFSLKMNVCVFGLDASAQSSKANFLADDQYPEIKVIGIRHGEKVYETLLTNEECANAVDMGNFYRVPADKRGLNYDKYFNKGDTERNKLTEFNSNNTRRLNVAETKEKIASLTYIKEELAKAGRKA